VLGVVLIFAAAATHAQTCTTQARMSDSVRNDLSGAAMNLAQSIREGNAAKVQASIIAEFASDASFAPTAAVIRTTAPKLAGDTVHVTQIYELGRSRTKARRYVGGRLQLRPERHYSRNGLLHQRSPSGALWFRHG